MKTGKIKSFWKKAFEQEITTLFNANEKNNILFNINNIIAKATTNQESLYKNFYDIIIVLKTNSDNNRSLYKNFMDHLQKRYIDHWDWTNKYNKEDADMHYYSLYCECRNKIEEFINKEYNSKTEDERALYTNTFNKYLAFFYILYTEVNKSEWTYNSESIVDDQKEIIKLNRVKFRVYNIKFFDVEQNILATFKSEKIIDLISEAVTGLIPKKIVFNPENTNKVKEIGYKKEIFELLKSNTRFINAIIKSALIAIKETGLQFDSDSKRNFFIYRIVDSQLPSLLISNMEPNDSDKSKRVKSIIRTVEKHINENYFCLLYNDKNNSLLPSDYLPELTYTDKDGNQKIITSFSDLF